MRAVMSCICLSLLRGREQVEGRILERGIAINQQTQLCSFTWISVTGIISCKQLRWPLEQTPSTQTEVFTLDYNSDIIPTLNKTFNHSSEISFGAFLDFTDALRFLHLLSIYNNLFTRQSMKPFIRFYLTLSNIDVLRICWKSWTRIKAWDHVRFSALDAVALHCPEWRDCCFSEEDEDEERSEPAVAAVSVCGPEETDPGHVWVGPPR